MKPRLLLVDDDPLIAESLAFVLEADYEVACASDRESAVARLREWPDAHLGDCRREILTGRGGDDDPVGEPDTRTDEGVDAELIERALKDPEIAALAAAEARTTRAGGGTPGAAKERSG